MTTNTPDDITAVICLHLSQAAMVAKDNNIGYYHFIDIFDEFMRESATAQSLEPREGEYDNQDERVLDMFNEMNSAFRLEGSIALVQCIAQDVEVCCLTDSELKDFVATYCAA